MGKTDHIDLGKTILYLQELSSIDEVYKYLVEEIYRMMGGRGIVTLVDYDTEDDFWKLHAIKGVGNQMHKVIDLLGFDFRKIRGKIKTDFYYEIIKGKLVKVELNLPLFFGNKINKSSAEKVKKLLSLEELYCMAIRRNAKVFANISILTKPQTDTSNFGEIEAFIQHASLVIDKKNADIALQENERRLSEAQRIARIGHVEFDVEKGKVWWADMMYELYERDPKLGPPDYKEVMAYHSPTDVKALEKCISNAVTKSKPYDIDLSVNLPNGKIAYYHAIGTPVKNKSGKVTIITGTVQDVTERVKVKLALEKQNQFVETVLDNLPIGLALNEFDEGIATYINDKFSEIYGWPREDLKDINSFFEKAYPDRTYREKIAAQVKQDVASGDPSRMHWENIVATTKDGNKRFINAVNIPLFDQNTMVSTVMDVTELHMAKEEVQQHKEKLEELVRERTAELEQANNSLVEKNKELKHFNKLFVDREFRINELKERMKKLESQLGTSKDNDTD
ncbi:MAG: PAS domain S-box protein [Bacteroidales bacterium]|nr:PAS domain S-box protein [Bacteroidales bacterium]MCF8343219.1 PAS domain S-box protein [Bacteroidales bacterium]MCF8351338.1 PAS domain S-box protein [Bacteroidales bacterium]MCF8376886.1 PAS domain S-box protein [Bacteroidales bacterium]MCF8401509.1 PAS domain S-box protein [Bacteroidales bacterium]